MAWDPSTGSVLMFGGRSASGPNLAETWSWDGANWSQLSPTTSPPASSDFGMASDLSNQRIVATVPINDLTTTWTWNGADWSRVPATTTKRTFFDPPIVYDGNNGAVIVPLNQRRTLLFNSSDWVPLDERPPHMFGMLASDTVRRRVIRQVVDQNSVGFSTTWEWDGSSWEAKTTGSAPMRDAAGAVITFDTATGRTLSFGGLSHSQGRFLHDIYEWDGTIWTARSVASGPVGRLFPAFSFDHARGVAVLYGGSYQGQVFFDTWEWNGINRTWTQRAPSTSPRLDILSSTYDPIRRRTLLQGRGPSLMNEYWEWDGTNWSQVPAASAPPPADVLGFDPTRGQVIGHKANVGTWSWDGATTTQLSTTGPVNPIGLTYDAARNRMLSFGSGSTWLFGSTVTPALATRYGNGCAGTLGTPILSPRGVPHIGNREFRVELSSANPSSPAVLLVALNSASQFFGNCQVLVDTNNFAVPMPFTSAAGYTELTLPIPLGSTLFGLSVSCQGLVADPGGAAFGVLTTTRGLRLTFGD